MIEDKKPLEETTPKQKREKVVTGGVKKKKRSFRDLFIAEDIENVGEYVIRDVVIPSIKKLIRDTICNGTDALLYSNGSGPSSNKGGSTISRPAYRKAFQSEQTTNNRSQNNRASSLYADIIFENRSDAEEILHIMDEVSDEYGFASIGDLYDLVGWETASTYNNYGWTRAGVKEAKIQRVSEGFLLKFPRPIPRD